MGHHHFQPSPLPAIQSIKFPCTFTKVFRVLEPRVVVEVAEFKLGDGPCGKSVSRLRMTRTKDSLTVEQVHADGTRKEFFYLMRDILGRIEVEYSA